MSSYAFESPNPEYRDAVIAILNHYIEETTAAYREEAVGPEFFPALLEDSAAYPAYVIVGEPGREVSGFCMLEPLMPISTFSEVAEVTYFLRPDRTGRGIGSLALKRLEEDAAARGIRRLVANLSSENGDSLAFHLRRGFREYGRLRNAGRKFGRRFDLVYLEKELDPGA
jgi:L-amino acid N-acyltransferase YncA